MNPYCTISVINNGIRELQLFFNSKDNTNVDGIRYAKLTFNVTSDNHVPPFTDK